MNGPIPGFKAEDIIREIESLPAGLKARVDHTGGGVYTIFVTVPGTETEVLVGPGYGVDDGIEFHPADLHVGWDSDEDHYWTAQPDAHVAHVAAAVAHMAGDRFFASIVLVDGADPAQLERALGALKAGLVPAGEVAGAERGFSIIGRASHEDDWNLRINSALAGIDGVVIDDSGRAE